MNVQLISLSKPVNPNLKTAEDLIVYCARVSNPQNQNNIETGSKLINYCIQHGHWSIFEQVSMTVEIKTSRAIAAQILRHRSFSFQEFSQRYSEATEFEEIELREQAQKNRQSSIDAVDTEKFNTLTPLIQDYMDSAKKLYSKLLECNIAKEVARFILPLTTTSTLYMSGNIRSWIHYIELRTKEDTQKEHKDIANKIKDIFIEQLAITNGKLRVVARLARQFMINLETKNIVQTRPKPNPQQHRDGI